MWIFIVSALLNKLLRSENLTSVFKAYLLHFNWCYNSSTSSSSDWTSFWAVELISLWTVTSSVKNYSMGSIKSTLIPFIYLFPVLQCFVTRAVLSSKPDLRMPDWKVYTVYVMYEASFSSMPSFFLTCNKTSFIVFYLFHIHNSIKILIIILYLQYLKIKFD